MQQSLCYETAIANWRRLKAAPDARNMGVLYWQLNDIWAVSDGHQPAHHPELQLVLSRKH